MDADEPLPEDVRLAQALEVLSNPTRIALLRKIRSPRTMSEIRLKGGTSPEPRSLARQSIKPHLDRLVEAGCAQARETRRNRGETLEYVVNPRALFALAEDLRALARLRPEVELSDPTQQATLGDPARDLEGPCLVLVRGLDEGTTYPLLPGAARRADWTLGRRRGLAVSLEFDPYVSAEHAVVAWENGVYSVQDLPDALNGTSVNFRLLPRGTRRALRTGDLIGIGRSLLLLRA